MQERWEAIGRIPKYERSRTAIRALLGIDDEPEPAPPEEDQDEQSPQYDSREESEAKLEEVNVDGERSRRLLRKTNRSNMRALIYLDRLDRCPLIEQESDEDEEEEEEEQKLNQKQQKHTETQASLRTEVPEAQQEAPQISHAGQNDDGDKLDSLNCHASDVADAHLDESNVTRLSLSHYEREQGHQPLIDYSASIQQSILAHKNQASSKEPVIDLCQDEPPKHAKQEVKLEQEVAEVSSYHFHSSCRSKPARTGILHIDTTRPGAKPDREAKAPSLPAYKKKMQKNIKQLQKQFAKTISIADRRMVRSDSPSLYEYLWEFAGVSCWKSLRDHQSLLDLYLCQARSQNSPVLKYLPSELSNDLPYLIYKIETCPFTHDSLQGGDIERALHGNLFTMEVARYFQQALLSKALQFNRMCEAEREQQERYVHMQSAIIRPKARTVFVDLEEEKKPVKVKLPAEPKLESSVGMSRTHPYSFLLKTYRQ